jgi:hypothetical protein
MDYHDIHFCIQLMQSGHYKNNSYCLHPTYRDTKSNSDFSVRDIGHQHSLVEEVIHIITLMTLILVDVELCSSLL